MTHTLKVSSKSQITLPVEVTRRTGINKGDILTVAIKNNTIVLSSTRSKLKSLAGSLKKPSHKKNLDIDTVIKQSKQAHFKHRK